MNTLAALEEVSISQADFDSMLEFSRCMIALKKNPKYIASIQENLPDTADAMHHEASILMGFDFHLTDGKPQLIEINNNAGGLYIGDAGWMPQDDISIWSDDLKTRILSMFPASWQTIAIMDDDVTHQYMYPEMQAYAALLRQDDRQVFVVSPEDISLCDDGLYVEHQRLDAIYNRHTDFYLNTPELLHIRKALMAHQIKLNPYPRSYALLGHKERMADWWREGVLESCIDDEQVKQIRALVPKISLMREADMDELWQSRKQWVFKPSARHGGKGVVLGKSMSRKRFYAFDPNDTVVQQFVPASVVRHEDVDYKFDVRLYMHGENLIAMAGRLWRGQVTNFREEGSGWTKICVC
ncbi:MAG: hypothetical protein Q9M18_09100 [Mariprofundaceae bacterium]|nr:hypothetical protein [Mariprofundaceae bacterium]